MVDISTPDGRLYKVEPQSAPLGVHAVTMVDTRCRKQCTVRSKGLDSSN